MMGVVEMVIEGIGQWATKYYYGVHTITQSNEPDLLGCDIGSRHPCAQNELHGSGARSSVNTSLANSRVLPRYCTSIVPPLTEHQTAL